MWSSTTIKQEFWLKIGGIVGLYARYFHTNFRRILSSSLQERVSEYTWCPRIDNLLYITSGLLPIRRFRPFRQEQRLLIGFILVCQCFTGLMACYKNLKFHVIGVHVNALRFGVAKIWKF